MIELMLAPGCKLHQTVHDAVVAGAINPAQQMTLEVSPDTFSDYGVNLAHVQSGTFKVNFAEFGLEEMIAVHPNATVARGFVRVS